MTKPATPLFNEMWAEREKLRSDRARLIEALSMAADTFRDFAIADHAIGKLLRATSSEIAEEHARNLLRDLEAK